MAKNELNSLAVSAFCESMAMMLEAGIQPDEAAGLLLFEGGQRLPLAAVRGLESEAFPEFL